MVDTTDMKGERNSENGGENGATDNLGRGTTNETRSASVEAVVGKPRQFVAALSFQKSTTMQTIKVSGWYVVPTLTTRAIALRFERGEKVHTILDGPFAYRIDAEESAR